MSPKDHLKISVTRSNLNLTKYLKNVTTKTEEVKTKHSDKVNVLLEFWTFKENIIVTDHFLP